MLDGHDIKVLNIVWLRSLIGLVQQEPVLFNLSIRENIAYGLNDQQVTQEQIEEAARMANIHDLIVALPQGYDTMCGARGSQLSGGEKQRSECRDHSRFFEVKRKYSCYCSSTDSQTESASAGRSDIGTGQQK